MQTYNYYKKIFCQLPRPLAYIDLNYLDENISSVMNRIGAQRKIRIATKSIRCVNLIKYILNKSSQFCGLMTYDANETIYLSQNGFDHILIGYPITHEPFIEKIILEIKAGKDICFMVDKEIHIQILQSIARRHNAQVKICLDIDVSQNYYLIYFGANRSSLKTKKNINEICDFLKKCPNLILQGIMGYEGQIAGVSDQNKGEFLKNCVIQFLKRISIKKISQLRNDCYEIIKQQGFNLNFVNGGGSGSLETTVLDSIVTELTVGSAFYSPHLLDSYCQFKHQPAAGFVLEITRHPQKNIFTAHGGGYHSSGSLGQNKTPQPYLPHGLHLLPNESAGEVQTPFVNKGETLLQIGDPVLFRHAKAGEMCERFNKLYLVSDGKVVACVKTYRGDGLCTL